MVVSESSTITLDDEDKALKSMLDSFGSMFSIQDIASAFCKARGDAHLAGELLCGIGISSSDTAYHLCNGDEKSNTSSKNISPDETNPLELETTKFSGSVHSSGEPLSESDNSFYKEIENYLFEILGNSFQLERSAIHDVLSQCGYDMKKSMETLLDLAAITLDQRNDFDDSSKSKSNSESLSSQNQVHKQIIEESRSRTMTTNAFLLKKTIERYEQQDFVYVEDEDVEGSYGFLRKAVKEYRDAMKEYYKAAVKAFASSDHARAVILLEKGHFYSNKAREANDESARKIFETSSEDEEINDEMCLDLQHHDRKEAIRLLKCHLHSLSGIPSIKILKIILGVGGKYVERRKRLVKKLLEREAIGWIEDENSGTILIRLDEINPYYLSFSSTRHEE